MFGRYVSICIYPSNSNLKQVQNQLKLYEEIVKVNLRFLMYNVYQIFVFPHFSKTNQMIIILRSNKNLFHVQLLSNQRNFGQSTLYYFFQKVIDTHLLTSIHQTLSKLIQLLPPKITIGSFHQTYTFILLHHLHPAPGATPKPAPKPFDTTKSFQRDRRRTQQFRVEIISTVVYGLFVRDKFDSI